MKEHPILFSAEMVRALLSGTKTQTRRVLKNVPDWVEKIGCDCFSRAKGNEWVAGRGVYKDQGLAEKFFKCPFGEAGDVLWVREAWRTYSTLDHCKPSDICIGAGVQYMAGGSNVRGYSDILGMGRCRPSIHMPRWASRITLEVTNIKVERLQDISRADAKQEGFLPGVNGLESWKGKLYGNAELVFHACWDTINGKKYPWASNPFVWAIEFKVLTNKNQFTTIVI